MKCLVCGKEITEEWRKDPSSKKRELRFCSRSCSNKFSSNSSSRGLTKTEHCAECGKEITIGKRASSSKTLCTSCRAKHRKADSIKFAESAKTYTCTVCGKSFESKSPPKLGTCSIACFHKAVETESVYNEELEKRGLPKKFNWECPVCGKNLRLPSREASQRVYCSGTCRNIATNPDKNGSVSKAELLLGDMIEQSLGEKIERNRRDLLEGLEVDIWIPSLQIGIEYNGIYHLKPIHGKAMLDKIRKKDQLKRKLAKEKGFDLYVVEDYKNTPKEVRKLCRELLKKIIDR